MVDKITTVPKNKLGQRIGELEPDDMARVKQAILECSWAWLGDDQLASAALREPLHANCVRTETNF